MYADVPLRNYSWLTRPILADLAS